MEMIAVAVIEIHVVTESVNSKFKKMHNGMHGHPDQNGTKNLAWNVAAVR